jgi:hypothetical protein
MVDLAGQPFRDAETTTAGFVSLPSLGVARVDARGARTHTRRRFGSKVSVALTTAGWKFRLDTEPRDELVEALRELGYLE